MNENHTDKFARFTLKAGGHVYLRVRDIDSVTDPSAGEQYDETRTYTTILTCGAHRYIVEHHYTAVLDTLDAVMTGRPQQTAVPPIPPKDW